MAAVQDIDPDADDDFGVGLPKGSKNYLTPCGYQAMLDELEHLWRAERPKVVEVVSWAAGNGDRSENLADSLIFKSQRNQYLSAMPRHGFL